jgi:hypothetical protein
MESSHPDYIAELLRHFADLRDGTHGGATSRRDKEGFFTAAVPLLDPYARQSLAEINTDLLLGTGEVTATGIRRRGGGVDAIWALSWPEQQAAGRCVMTTTGVSGAASAVDRGRSWHRLAKNPAELERNQQAS